MKFFTQMIVNIKGRCRTAVQEEYEEADAIILDFHPTGFVRNGMFEVRILLQVMPRNERSYIMECSEYFTKENLQELHSGNKTKIFLCRTEPSKIRWMKHAKDGA